MGTSTKFMAGKIPYNNQIRTLIHNGLDFSKVFVEIKHFVKKKFKINCWIENNI